MGGLQARAGIFFAAVFVEGLFPLPGFALLLAIPYIILLAHDGSGKFSINIFMLPLLAISFYYLLFIFSSEGAVDFSLVRKILYFYCMVLMFVFGNIQAEPLRFLYAFWACLIPSALFASLLGICKVVLQEQGYVISGFVDIYNNFSVSYPYGSSLRTDYNIFSLSLLVALVGVIVNFLKAEGVRRGVAVLQMALLLLAIYLSGSRRAYGFLILSVIWGGWVSARCYGFFCFLRYSAVFIVLAFFIVFISESILSGKIYDDYKRFPGDIFSVLEHETAVDVRSDESVYKSQGAETVSALHENHQYTASSYQGQIITYTPGRLASTVISDDSLGLASRIERWAFAVELLQARGGFLGQGFSYQAAFSCEFVSCAHSDYPHNVFLSEFLLAGFVGLSLSLVAIFSLIFLALKSQAEFWTSGAGVVMVIALPTLLISGDGVFSISQVVASFFFAFLFLKNKYLIAFPLSHAWRLGK
jgi:hypothetical protein